MSKQIFKIGFIMVIFGLITMPVWGADSLVKNFDDNVIMARGNGHGPGDGTGHGGSGPKDGTGHGPKWGDCPFPDAATANHPCIIARGGNGGGRGGHGPGDGTGRGGSGPKDGTGNGSKKGTCINS